MKEQHVKTLIWNPIVSQHEEEILDDIDYVYRDSSTPDNISRNDREHSSSNSTSTAADGADLTEMELDAAVEMLHPAQHFRRNSVSGFSSTGQSEAQSESVQLSKDALLDPEPPLVGDQEAMFGTVVAFVSLMFENARYIATLAEVVYTPESQAWKVGIAASAFVELAKRSGVWSRTLSRLLKRVGVRREFAALII